MSISRFEITGAEGVTDGGTFLVGQELSIRFVVICTSGCANVTFTAKQNNAEIARYSRRYLRGANSFYNSAINDNFYIGKIQGTGNITITGTAYEMILDGEGSWHSDPKTTTLTRTYTMGDYKPTTITALNGLDIAVRCKQAQDAYGSNAGYQAASDGDRIMLNFQVNVPSVSGRSNSATVSLKYGAGSVVGQRVTRTISMGTATLSSPVKKSNDTSTITSTFDVNKDYWFSLTATDSFGISTTANAYIGKMESIFNIEPYGVAIGQLSTGTSANKKFECAYPAYFTSGATITNPTFSGTITGINTHITYQSGEVNTGDKWIDGNPIYRYILKQTMTVTSPRTTIGKLPRVAKSLLNYHGYIYVANMYRGIPFAHPTGDNDYNCGLVINTDGQTLTFVAGTSLAGSHELCVIVEYT